ncbi:MAG: universal stress protein [Burkholderiales bacterium]|nr:universal stress protein [Burkholderiales bacterium]
MEYKTILVHLDRRARSRVRLELAVDLAGTFGAHLVGLYAVEALRFPAYLPAHVGSMVEQAEANYQDEARAMFEQAVSRRPGLSAEWRAGSGDPVGALCLSARYADLVVAGQHDPDASGEEGLPEDFVERAILAAGRPVLVIPYAGQFTAFGRRVLVAWNAAREAARAVTDALPLLARADSVQVAAFDPDRQGDHGELPGADLGLYLARHGVKVSVGQHYYHDVEIGSQILSRAADTDADLIVMGAYGHSRTRELILGGATRTLLDSMTVPVLMSH